jgi:hypothetical protein
MTPDVTPVGRKVRGALYRGHDAIAHDVEGVLVVLGGVVGPGMISGGGLSPAGARALVDEPLTLACYRGPLVSVAIHQVEVREGLPVLLLVCRERTFGPPLDVLDEVEIEGFRR